MWICKKFNVLPTSPDFQNLTFEMRELLYADFLLDNPKLAQKIENDIDTHDSSFNELWDKSKDEDFDKVDITDGLDIELDIDEDIPYSPEGRNVLEQIKKHQSEQKAITNHVEMWEEVDLDSIDEEFAEFDFNDNE